jgi:excisionase family DNA binding protein
MTDKQAPARRNIGGGLSIPAAAAELGLPEYTLRKAVDRGEVTAVKFGGLRRIPPAEIERLRETFFSASA